MLGRPLLDNHVSLLSSDLSSQSGDVDICKRSLFRSEGGPYLIDSLYTTSREELLEHLLEDHLKPRTFRFYGCPIYDIQVAAVKGYKLDPLANAIVSYLDLDLDIRYFFPPKLRKILGINIPLNEIAFPEALVGTLNYLSELNVIDRTRVPWSKIRRRIPHAESIRPEVGSSELSIPLFDRAEALWPIRFRNRGEYFSQVVLTEALGDFAKRFPVELSRIRTEMPNLHSRKVNELALRQTAMALGEA